jgi:alpha-galactosidase
MSQSAAVRCRARRAAIAGVAAALICVALVDSRPARAQPAPRVLAATPYMGWDSSYALPVPLSEAAVLAQAARIKSAGLEADGYRLIWLDAGWWLGQRDAAGEIVVSSTQWPHGIAWLAATLHRNGFEFGLYTDAGATGCGGAPAGGSLGHYQQDIDTMAAWGVDAVKVDWCGGATAGLDPATQYGEIHQAIVDDSPHRPMLLEVCNFLQPGQSAPGVPSFDQSAFSSYTFGPSVANSWRTDTDIGSRGRVPFSSVLRNLDADATQPQVAGAGHWNDPGYLSPGQGMSAAQFRTQLSMWAIVAAPLMVSDNMPSISSASLTAIANKALIAIDQDPAGIQGWLVPGSASGNGEAWAKPLADGSYAVALLNRGPAPQTVSTITSEVGLPAAPAYTVKNVWDGRTSTTTGALTATVAAYSTVLMRVSAR